MGTPDQVSFQLKVRTTINVRLKYKAENRRYQNLRLGRKRIRDRPEKVRRQLHLNTTVDY